MSQAPFRRTDPRAIPASSAGEHPFAAGRADTAQADSHASGHLLRSTASGTRSVPFFRQLTVLLLLVAVLSVLAGCGSKKTAQPPQPASLFTPYGPPVARNESAADFVKWLRPQNQELFSWKEAGPTVRKSLAYMKNRRDSDVAVSRGGLRVTWGELKDAMERLHALLPRLDAEPDLFLKEFRWVSVPGGIKYSGYYEPRIRASRTKKPGFTQPIYAKPPDLASYRRRHGRYHSREAIDGPRKVLANRGLELAWADPVDVYFLQIQGSGKLLFDDNTTAYVNYDGQNGHKYRASGRIIREKGYKLFRGDIFEQRQWFKDHPDRMNEIFFANPSYVFFRFSNRGATGAIGRKVDDWLSLATDRNFLPLGGIVAYAVNAPDPDHGTVPLRGLGFAQDTGGAIKGNRIDIYCGGSERGNYVASFLDAAGPAWLLLRR